MSPHILTGVAAALVATLFGTVWQLLTRHGVTTTLGPMEMAVLRYAVPALVLLPVWWRIGLRPAGVSWPHLALLVCGGGLPFGLLVLAGAQFAPAAHMGVFMAGTIPLFTALVAWLAFREPMRTSQWLGFALILGGVGWLGFAGLSLEAWRGDVLFLLAAIVWAVYTVAFRRCGLNAWQGAAIVNGWSFVALLMLLPFTGAPRLLTAPWRDVLVQGLGQGVMAGLLGLVAYMAAVTRLGAARASLSAAAVPPLVALGGSWVLGEPGGFATWGAAVSVACGVAIASGAFSWRPGVRPAVSST